jgi:hypothetical protein
MADEHPLFEEYVDAADSFAGDSEGGCRVIRRIVPQPPDLGWVD